MKLNVFSDPPISALELLTDEFWARAEVELMLAPKTPFAEVQYHRQQLEVFLSQQNLSAGYIVLATSGTTREAAQAQVAHKFIFLQKSAVLNAAQLMIQHYRLLNESWLLNLPLHHISGISVAARAWLMKSALVPFVGWKPQQLLDLKPTKSMENFLISLVPTQIFDLVQSRSCCPSHICKVFVGGGQMSASLNEEAQQLGWPVVQTFGMTETSAMMAEYDFSRECFHPFSGVDIRVNNEQMLEVFSPGLFDFEYAEGKMRFKREGFYCTDDLASLVDPHSFRLLGRIHHQVKVLGELVNLQAVENRALQFLNWPSHLAALVAVPDPRNEHKLILCLEADEVPQGLYEKLPVLNNSLVGYERIADVMCVKMFPRTDLGKINRNELKSEVLKKI